MLDSQSSISDSTSNFDFVAKPTLDLNILSTRSTGEIKSPNKTHLLLCSTCSTINVTAIIILLFILLLFHIPV